MPTFNYLKEQDLTAIYNALKEQDLIAQINCPCGSDGVDKFWQGFLGEYGKETDIIVGISQSYQVKDDSQRKIGWLSFTDGFNQIVLEALRDSENFEYLSERIPIFPLEQPDGL
jgi:hypothetical protein